MSANQQSLQKIVKTRFGINVTKLIICLVSGIIIVFQAGGISALISRLFMNVETDLIKTIITQIGLALITYAIIDSVFSVHQNRKLNQKIDSFATRLEKNIGILQSSVGITKGAVKIGLTAVNATRADAIAEIREKMQEIIDICKGGNNQTFTIKILGISLGDYLCPHGPLYLEFKELIRLHNVKIELLILRDGSYSAIQRAKIEEQYVFNKNREAKYGDKEFHSAEDTCPRYQMNDFDPGNGCIFGGLKSNIDIDAVDCFSYLQTKCHNELRTATLYLYNLCNNEAYIKKWLDEKLSKEDEEYQKAKSAEEKDTILRHKLLEEKRKWQEKWHRIKSYDYAPLLLMIEFDDTMFVENYHLASRGGESPILQIKKGTDLFKIYEEHFCSLFGELGLSSPIDSSSCLNQPCSKGIAVARDIEEGKEDKNNEDKQEDQDNTKDQEK